LYINKFYKNTRAYVMHFCLLMHFVENNLTYSSANLQIQMILKERCDGNRNVLHACINMCSPTSNKETEQGI